MKNRPNNQNITNNNDSYQHHWNFLNFCANLTKFLIKKQPKLHWLISSLTILYIGIVIFTDYSLTGFWTDLIFSLLIVTFSNSLIFNKDIVAIGKQKIALVFLRVLSVIASLAVYGFFILIVFIPFAWNTFGTVRFDQVVDERHFHVYFKPVGAGASGAGILWISESPRWLPFIEQLKHAERGYPLPLDTPDSLDGNKIEDILENDIRYSILDKENP